MATARLEMRIDPEIKRMAEKASALAGYRNLTDYLVHLMESDATRVIADHEAMIVPGEVFDRFIEACEEETGPSDALRMAVSKAREMGIE